MPAFPFSGLNCKLLIGINFRVNNEIQNLYKFYLYLGVLKMNYTNVASITKRLYYKLLKCPLLPTVIFLHLCHRC